MTTGEAILIPTGIEEGQHFKVASAIHWVLYLRISKL